LKKGFEKKEKNKPNPLTHFSTAAQLPPFFSLQSRPSSLPAHAQPSASGPTPLPLSQQLAGGPHPSGHPQPPAPPPLAARPPASCAAVLPPRPPRARPLLHRAIKAPPHSPTAASALPLPVTGAAPSRPPPPLMAGRRAPTPPPPRPSPFPLRPIKGQHHPLHLPHPSLPLPALHSAAGAEHRRHRRPSPPISSYGLPPSSSSHR
jgi:hypothetical protein